VSGSGDPATTAELDEGDLTVMKRKYPRTVAVLALSLAAVAAISQLDRRQQEAPSFRRLPCRDAVHCVAFSPDGKTLAVGTGVTSGTGEIKLWDLANLQRPRTLSGHKSWIVSLAFAPDSSTLGTASYDTVQRWDLAARQPIVTQCEDFGPICRGRLTFRPDLKQLAIATVLPSGPSLQLRSIPSNDAPLTLDYPEFGVGLAFSADGRRLAAAGVNTGVRVYDTGTGTLGLALPGVGNVSALAFGPDGTILAVGDLWGRVQLWNLVTAEVRTTWLGHTQAIWGIAFSPDGRLLAMSDQLGFIKLCDTTSGAEVADIPAHTDAVTALAFSPDGDWLASASLDTTVGLWRISAP
jgi:WD40 repeat protein